MKLLILVHLLIGIVIADTRCFESFGGVYMCPEIILLPYEPFQFDNIHTNLHLVNSSGSIGKQTFSGLSQLEDLTIKYSNIPNIENGSLCYSLKLRSIHIIDNTNFPPLRELHFSSCDKIENLHISSQSFEPTIFRNLPNLKTLSLRGHIIPNFYKGYLESLRQLEKLTIENCQVGQIEPGALCSSPKLYILNIIGNKRLPYLTESLFSNCYGVTEFIFTGNGHVTIGENIFRGFENIINVQVENLDFPRLTRKDLAGLKTVSRLSLERCNIATIDANAFSDLTGLEKLSLSYNNLNYISPEVFSNLKNLTILELSSNRITTMDNLVHFKLHTLEIEKNLINKIDVVTARSNLPNLVTLVISENPMTPEYVDHLRYTFIGADIISYRRRKLS